MNKSIFAFINIHEIFFKEKDNSLIDPNWGLNDNKSLPDPKIIDDPSNTYPTLVLHGFNDHC